MGDWNALAKVENPDMKKAVDRAKQVTQTGASYKSAFDAAKNAFSTKKTEGEGLVAMTPEGASWPALLTTLDAALPDPAAELKLDSGLPANQEILRDLRVYVDAIVPRFRTDLKTAWFETTDLQGFPKNYMHPLDRGTAPEGEGWVIQVVGHHYNPSPIGPNSKKLTAKEKPIAKGPVRYLTDVVIRRFWTPKMRQFGIHHATLTWVEIDDKWVSSKVAGNTALPAAPLLAKDAAPASSSGSSGSSGGSDSAMAAYYAQVGNRGMGNSSGSSGGMDSSAAMAAYYATMSRGYPGASAASKKVEETTLTRTNFMIQFVWQPPAADAQPKSPEEVQKALADIQEALVKAEKAPGAPRRRPRPRSRRPPRSRRSAPSRRRPRPPPRPPPRPDPPRRGPSRPRREPPCPRPPRRRRPPRPSNRRASAVSGSRTLGFQIADSGFQIPDSGFKYPKIQESTGNLESGIWNPESGIRNPESGIYIRNTGRAIIAVRPISFFPGRHARRAGRFPNTP